MALGEKLRNAMEKLRKAAVFDRETIKEVVKELQRALIAADVEIKLVLELSKKIEETAASKLPPGLNRREHVIKTTYDLLAELIGGQGKEAPESPKKILLVGLYGQGKCVHPDSIIPLANGSNERIEDIYNKFNAPENVVGPGEFVKETNPFEVFSIDPQTMKTVKGKVKTVWKMKKTEPLIKRQLDNGNNHSIIVTPEHPFFVLENGIVKKKRADELKLNQFIAVPKKIKINENPNLLSETFFENISKGFILKDKKLALEAKEGLKKRFGTLTSAYKKLNCSESFCSFVSGLKQGKISGKTFRALMEKGIIEKTKKETIQVSASKSSARKTMFPLVFSPGFGEFLGYLLGDGYIYKNYLEITNENKEIISNIYKLSKKMFGITPKIKKDKRRKQLYSIRINSKTLVELIKKIFSIPAKNKSKRMRIPKIVMCSGKKTINAFLRAYFDCDGFIAQKQRQIEFSTASKNFASDLRMLLLNLGLHSSFSKKIIKGEKYYLIKIRSKDVEVFADKIGSIVPFKKKRLAACKKIGLKQGFGKHELIQVGSLLKEIREYYGATIGEMQKHVKSYGIYEQKGIISKNSLKKFLSALNKTKNKNNKILELALTETNSHNILEKTKENTGWLNASLYRLKELGLIETQNQKIKTTQKGAMLLEKQKVFDETKIVALQLLAEAEINWIKIRGIETNETTKYVYDFTVEKFHNFVANNVIVHNTTSTGKLAKYYLKRGKKVGIIAADTFRPAAFEQLKQLSEKIKVPFYGNPKEKKAEKVVKEGLKELKGMDLIIVDSAGRDGFNKELVKEIKAVNDVFKPEEKWLVIGADIGQVAKKQAEEFHKAVGVNGVIITRVDGSAKGGGALAACAVSKAPVYFLGTGEKLDDLEKFDAQRYLSRIMGYGDLQALLEKAAEAAKEGEIELSPEALLKGELNFKTFYEQLKAARKMGPLSKVAEMMGLKMQLPQEMLEMTEEKLDCFRIIIDSMTEEERLDPELLNKSRIQRIAKGSGKSEQAVRELIKQFKTMKKMFKKFKKLGSGKDLEKLQKKGGIEKIMQQLAGKKKKIKIR